MIDKLFSSKTRMELLRLLLFNPGESFYQRQMSALTHQPIRAIQREVKKLELLGVLVKSIRGNRIYYKANRDCPIYDELKAILFKTTGIAQVLRENLGKSRTIQSAFVYGSYARGQESLSSDIDLFVIGDITSRGLSSLLSKPKKELGREINYAVLRSEEFRRRISLKDGFLNTVVRDRKIFVVGDEDEFRAIAREEQARAPHEIKRRGREAVHAGVSMTKEKIKQILSANKEILKKFKVESIALFGSYVRNEQEEGSDIDFLVELGEPTYDNFINLVFSLERLFGKDVNLVLEGGLSPYLEPYVRREAEKIEV